MASFEGGRLNVESEQRSGRPQTSTTGDNMEQVRTVVEEDRRRTCQDIENITGIPHKYHLPSSCGHSYEEEDFC